MDMRELHDSRILFSNLFEVNFFEVHNEEIPSGSYDIITRGNDLPP